MRVPLYVLWYKHFGFSQQYRRHRVFSRRRDITLKFLEKTNVEESRLYSFFFPLLVFVLAFFCLLSSFSRTFIWQKGAVIGHFPRPRQVLFNF